MNSRPRAGKVTKLVERLWAYIKEHGLTDPVNKRQINADEKLKVLFGGKSSVSMFDLTKIISQHVA